MPVKPNMTKDKFGDDLMIKAKTTPQGGGLMMPQKSSRYAGVSGTY